ncbi:toll-like receptor 1 [Engraulis encrasicolus]|uniref:toll-like receptor 1 n=1 Tax=Engraulis encrasicolus TaxID=184585 RepID=UPI002FCF540D
MGSNINDRAMKTCMTLREHVVDFTHHNFTKIPEHLPTQTEYLDVSDNNISRIDKGQLRNLTQLCFLKATHCNLQFISPSAFENNNRLMILNVSHNLLKTIPDVGMHTLTILDLSRNQYSNYGLPHSFGKLQDLDVLALGSKLAVSVNLTDFAPLKGASVKHFIFGGGVLLQQYKPGSLAQFKLLKEVTLNISFCQSFDVFDQILMDLNQTKTQELNLMQFVPRFCNISADPFHMLKHCESIHTLAIIKTWINSTFLVKLAKNIWDSPIKYLNFIDIVYNEDTSFKLPRQSTTSKVQSIVIDGIRHYQYRYPEFKICVDQLTDLTYIKFSGTGMNILPCNLSSGIPSLQTLDFSNNLLTDRGFWWWCPTKQTFPALRHLSLSHNRFSMLDYISQQTKEMNLLESLDLSFNSISLSGPCTWSSNLTELSLSHNNLGNNVFNYLSPHFRRLDLSKTGITAISQEVLSQLPNLMHLILSSNSIQTIPLNLRAPVLQVLHIDQNAIAYISKGVLDGLPNLETLVAGKNPFSCTCDSYWFLTGVDKSLLPDWPFDYTCSTPTAFANTSLVNFQPGYLSCQPWLQAVVSLSVLTIISAVFGITFYVCDGAWYTKMLWVWIRVKRRARKGEDRLLRNSFRYHAFISYSQHDSAWVDTQLVPTLEGAGLSLCIHERDFVPGQWIVDNIINCVEDSYKTIFVLSQNFVQSDWCNYELFFAQHRAISVDQDSVVFILLEPIPPDSLPRRFLKLRTLLRKQTYLEWPKNDCKKHLFWKSLRSMLQAGNSVMKDVAAGITESCALLADQH